MKKLINDPQAVVDETVRGFARAHAGHVVLVEDPIHIHRADAPVSGKVGIVSGGGSGHEPLHAGFVGYGMLDAAVPGPVFTSPTPDPIVAATKAVDGGAGVLHIVKNYTGDVLNFETAAELAGMDDVRVESVVVDDDVAVQDSLYTAGRRGVAGTVVVEKCAGAAAERGDDLDAVAAVARHVNDVTRSMGSHSPPAPSRTPASRRSPSPTTRSSSASASTASPAANASRWPRPTSSWTACSNRSSPTSPLPPGRSCCSS